MTSGPSSPARAAGANAAIAAMTPRVATMASMRSCFPSMPSLPLVGRRLVGKWRARQPLPQERGESANVALNATRTPATPGFNKKLPEETMRRALLPLSLFALLGANAAFAQDHLKIAIGNRNVGETFVTELGAKAVIFKKHGLALDIFYTDGGGETQQAVISNSAQIGVAVGFLGVLGVYAKGAPVRVIGSSFTGGSQMFWYVPAGSPIKSEKDLTGQTGAHSTHRAPPHLPPLPLPKHTRAALQPAPARHAPPP